ncbi:YbaK/EbsC family protein [Variovorax sp. J22P240]|uniref:aminoacyl-tRNA deacylase n=1 Tax=Variovorax sp. J22P240 TaxID=3053514 RepID=UPI002576C625|nr:YbaK/EbsC family protein [Variovorax sp. J22P240]MDM0001123.1 YbaK/EbsC family protein [Variovorax sp. J22P240]
MSIPSHLSSYLDQRGARYEVSMHGHSHSSLETAHCANVSPCQLAKSVILEDEDGCVMAVVPADRMVMLGEFSRFVGRHRLKLAGEARIAALFDDCAPGAIPPVGMAWGLPTIVDDELESNDVVYMEGGDHERLLRMSHDQFRALMRGQPHGSFSKTPEL